MKKGDEIAKEAEFAFLKSYAAGSCLDEDICRDRLQMLWTAFCLHHDPDICAYDQYLLAVWAVIQETDNGTSEWDGYEDFESFMCTYL